MASVELGRLEKVDLRVAWTKESTGFTPWLGQSENINVLGAAIGMELEVVAQEKNVGPFRADLLCKDLSNPAVESWVLIENQLERTDHTHLGQLMTYAAGLQAVTIIWVAREFTDEHRAALDWLNQITSETIRFFGLEIELWRIGSSPVAPKFNVISKPNEWSRTVAPGTSGSDERGQLYLSFWEGFHKVIKENGAGVKAPPKPRPDPWMDIRIGRSDSYLCAILFRRRTSGLIKVSLILHDEQAHDQFRFLESHKAEIEESFGEALLWDYQPDRQRCRIDAVKEGLSLDNPKDWPAMEAWFKDNLIRMQALFKPWLEKGDEIVGKP